MAGKGLGAFGSQRQMEVPEGFTPQAFTWLNMARVIVDGLADSWFEDLGPITLSDSLTAREAAELEFMRESMPYFFGEDETKVLPQKVSDVAWLGEPVPIDESPLGQKLIKVLKDNGVTWEFREERLELNAVSGVLMPSLKLEAAGQWGTLFGMPFDQVFKVYRDASGQDRILWGADLLAATRPFEHLTIRYGYDSETNERFAMQNDPEAVAAGGLTFGQWSTRVFIPVLLKWLFYLAETPFPTNLMNFPRTMAYGSDFAKELMPTPYFMNKRNSRVSGAFDLNNQGYLTSAARMPNVIEAGWVIEDMSEENLANCIVVASNGLTRMQSILEDGYLNHRTTESQFVWDPALHSAVVFDSDCELGGDALGLSTWVPVPRIGFVLNDTYQRAPGALDSGNFAELEQLSFNGAGPYVANCINSFVFSHLMNTDFYYMIDRLLESAYLMDVGDESTNALSNWGIALYKRGETAEAIKKFDMALAREDKYSEAEASWWLAKIYREAGNPELAATYDERCQKAGGYDADTGFAPEPAAPSVSSGKIGAPSLAEQTTPKFCSNCGSAFQSEANFCPNCGAKRG